MASKPGSIVHVELHSADPAKTKQFYGEVFGWKFEEMPEMNYIMWRAENAPGGGIMQTMEGRPPQVLNYIMSESVDNTLRDIMGAGGIVIQPGDLVFGDYDGVVAVPASILPEALQLARNKVSKENHSREELREGEFLSDVYEKYGIL